MGKEREIRILTGSEGCRKINHYYEVALNHELAIMYHKGGTLSNEEFISIKDMLNSEDEDNHTIAFMALKHLTK